MDPWTPYVLPKHLKRINKIPNLFLNSFHISQQFGKKQTLETLESTRRQHMNTFFENSAGPKQSSISIFVNRNGKQDGGFQ